MRRWLFLAAVAAMGLANTGCLINDYASNPTARIKELMIESENLRQIQGEWERIWFLDMPSHLTPERVDGGIG